MLTLFVLLAVFAGIIGLVGSIVPGLPGPPVSWIGLLFAYLAKKGTALAAGATAEPMSTTFLIVWLVITIAVTIADYVVPAYFTKLTGGSKYAGRGAIIGLLAGMFIPPVGILFGTIIGAFLAELLLGGKDGWQSFKSSLGAFAGFLFGTGIKLISSGIMLYYIILYIK